jgi:chemotaxis signal transduction protein
MGMKKQRKVARDSRKGGRRERERSESAEVRESRSQGETTEENHSEQVSSAFMAVHGFECAPVDHTEEGIRSSHTAVESPDRISAEHSEVSHSPTMPEEESQEFLAFRMNGEEYAIEIQKIKEVIRSLETTCIPRTPDYVRGVISLRGIIVPIFDLAKSLGLRSPEEGKKSRMIVTSSEMGLCGFWVDSVTEVLKIGDAHIKQAPPTLMGERVEYIRGIGRFRDRMIIILDLEKALKGLDFFHNTKNGISPKILT